MAEQPEILPGGVELPDWDDFDTKRKNIFQSVKTTMAGQFPQVQNGVRLELHDLDYVDPERYSKAEEKEALLSNKFLHRRLRGTYKLFDDKTGELLDQREATVMRVPYLTDRGTFIHAGTEYCLQARTKILTKKGWLTIKDIVQKRMKVDVLSYDFDHKCFVWKPVVSWFKRMSPGKLGRAKFKSSGFVPNFSQSRQNFTSVWATPEHRVLNGVGEKSEIQHAKELWMLSYKLSDVQRQIVLGSLLGDGHITDDGHFRLAHAADQKAYLLCKARFFGGLVSDNGISDYTYDRVKHPTWQTQYGFSLRSLGELSDLRSEVYSGGVRNLTSGWYKEAGPLALAIWFGDDGGTVIGCRSNGKNDYALRLHTNNFQKAEVQELADWLRSCWGFSTVLIKENASTCANANINWAIGMSGTSARKFLLLVAPFMHPSLRAKIGRRPRCNKCKTCNKEVHRNSKKCEQCGGAKNQNAPTTVWWDTVVSSMGKGLKAALKTNKGANTLRRIKASFLQSTGAQLERKQWVYDIEVKDTHNFFANGVLVSNCTANQARLLPGVYTRRKASGETETHFNAKRGTGHSFRIHLEPDTGLMKLDIGQSSLRLYSLLHDLGVPDAELEKRWGKELLASNKEAYDPRVFEKAYGRLVRRPDPLHTREDKVKAIKDALAATKLDRGVLERTLPARVKSALAAAPEPAGDFGKSDYLMLADFLNQHYQAGIPLDLPEDQLAARLAEEIRVLMPGVNPNLLAEEYGHHKIAGVSSKGCLMAVLEPVDAAPIVAWAQEQIPARQLVLDGLEKEIHCTIRYGGKPGLSLAALKRCLKDHGPVRMTLGKLVRFANTDEGQSDALVVAAESPDLVALRKQVDEALGEQWETPKYKGFRPHCTIGYVKPGACKSLDGHARFAGSTYVFKKLIYSTAGSKKKIEISLI